MGMPGLASTDRIRSRAPHINAPSMSRNIDLYDVDFFKIVLPETYSACSLEGDNSTRFPSGCAHMTLVNVPRRIQPIANDNPVATRKPRGRNSTVELVHCLEPRLFSYSFLLAAQAQIGHAVRS